MVGILGFCSVNINNMFAAGMRASPRAVLAPPGQRGHAPAAPARRAATGPARAHAAPRHAAHW